MSQGSQEEVVIAEEDSGERLDRVLAARIEALSRSRLKALILDGAVAIRGATIRDPGYRVKSGDAVTVAVPPPAPAEPAGENIPLNIVYEDDDLIVIDKQRGLVVRQCRRDARAVQPPAEPLKHGDAAAQGKRRPPRPRSRALAGTLRIPAQRRVASVCGAELAVAQVADEAQRAAADLRE